MIIIDKNCFVTLEEAEIYFKERFGSSIWAESESIEKEKALITATKRLNNLAYIGYKKEPFQPLEFPRKLTQDSYCSYNMPEIPQEIKDATCEEAISIMEYVSNNGESSLNDPTFVWQSFKLGDVSQTSASANNSNTSLATNNKGLLSAMAYSLASKWTKKVFDIANPVFYEAY